MNISIEQLEELIVKYDRSNGSYPENEFEGRAFFDFVLDEMELNRDRYDALDLNYPELYDYYNWRRSNEK